MIWHCNYPPQPNYVRYVSSNFWRNVFRKGLSNLKYFRQNFISFWNNDGCWLCIRSVQQMFWWSKQSLKTKFSNGCDRLRVVTAVFHGDYSEHATPARSSCARARLALSLGTAATRLQPLRWTSIWQPSLSPENGVGRPARRMLPEYLIALRGIETACKMEWRHRMADCPKFWLQFVSRFRSR